MKSRILSLLLALLMIVSLWTVPAGAADAEAVYTHPTTGAKSETTFADAVALVNKNYGGSIALNKDVQVTAKAVNFDYGCVVELNGHTLYTAGGTMIMGFLNFRTDGRVSLTAENNHGTDAQKILRFQNGTVVCDGKQRNPQLANVGSDNFGIRMYNGILQLESIQMYSDRNCVDMYGSVECTETLRHSIKNSTLVSGAYGVLQSRNNLSSFHKKTDIDIENCTMGTLDVSGNGNNNYLFIVPQQNDGTTYICFKLQSTGDDVYRTKLPIPNELDYSYQPGTRYNHTIIIGKPDITIKLTIADWNEIHSSVDIPL